MNVFHGGSEIYFHELENISQNVSSMTVNFTYFHESKKASMEAGFISTAPLWKCIVDFMESSSNNCGGLHGSMCT